MNHSFHYKDLSKNSYIPFEHHHSSQLEDIKAIFTTVIQRLQLSGFVSFFFSIVDGSIIPISCTVLPDEKFDLWNSISSIDLIPHLLLTNKTIPNSLSQQIFAYKYPIYASKPFRIPDIPSSLACQRNIPGMISHSSYPFCALFGVKSTKESYLIELRMKKDSITQLAKKS
jgi:hypothetical protein